MKIFPYKIMKVSEGLRVKVSNHFYYSDFGIRDSDEMRRYGHRYINTGTPGTGFIERDSESHSYHKFVREAQARQKNSYLRMLLGKEPDYGREIERATAVLSMTEDVRKRDILDAYVNALRVGRTEERIERIIRGIKDRMGHQSNKFMVSVMSHYKNKISQLSHDMDAVEYKVKDTCTPEVYEAYSEMVEAFVKVVKCRRIWFYDESRKNKYVQVQFDLGIFDFIQAQTFLPIMRDSKGKCYYILPDCVIAARSSVNFDVIPIKEVAFVSQELSIEEPVEVLSARLGDAASMIRVPKLNLTFYFNHVHPIVDFTESIRKLQELQ